MNKSARGRLSIMMFLEYAIWGVWAPILYLHLHTLESFQSSSGDPNQTLINLVYMTMAIASIVALAAGQFVDRYFATEKFLAFSHFVGGILIFWIYYLDSFAGIFWVMLLHCLLYAPTVGLTNSIAMHNLQDADRDFGKVRLWGTIGWIVIAWVFAVWLGLTDGLIEHFSPQLKDNLVDFRQSLPEQFRPNIGQCLLVAGVLSWLMALFCLILPHTPPAKEATDPFAFLGGFKLMKKPSFAVLIIVAFLVSTELQFYYVLTPGFFNQSGGPFDQKQIAQVLVKEKYQNEAEDEAARLLPEINKFYQQQLTVVDDRTNVYNKDSFTKVLLENVYTPLSLREAKDLIEQGDSKEAGGNGDDKLSISELEKLDNDTSKMILKHYADLREQKGGIELSQEWVGPVMTFGQIAEVIILLLVPLSLATIGFRWTIAIGILAWSIRYFIFCLGHPPSLVIASQTLHGFGFGFFFVGAFLYADRIATPDVRASVQSFIIFVTYGIGMVISSLIAGPVADYFEGNWHYIFLVPAIITAVCTVVFVLVFRDELPDVKEEELETPELPTEP